MTDGNKQTITCVLEFFRLEIIQYNSYVRRNLCNPIFSKRSSRSSHPSRSYTKSLKIPLGELKAVSWFLFQFPFPEVKKKTFFPASACIMHDYISINMYLWSQIKTKNRRNWIFWRNGILSFWEFQYLKNLIMIKLWVATSVIWTPENNNVLGLLIFN